MTPVSFLFLDDFEGTANISVAIISSSTEVLITGVILADGNLLLEFSYHYDLPFCMPITLHRI